MITIRVSRKGWRQYSSGLWIVLDNTFLDCDTVGPAQTNQEEARATGETVHDCKDKTNNELLHETPRQISSRLFT